MRTRLLLAACLMFVAQHAVGFSQGASNRERAKPAYLKGWQLMKVESFPEAAKAFSDATDIDPEYDDAYYGLGLANMRMKQYRPALAAYSKCRDLYQSVAGKRFTNRQEVQRYRQQRLSELDEVIASYQTGNLTNNQSERLRQLGEQRRQLQEYLQRGSDMTVEKTVPAYVYLALGSAYFRLEQWPDAEREYKAAVDADRRSGEAFNNLAVVYMQTGRYKEADEAVKSAEKVGYKVHPQLKEDIKAKLG
jgi:tetratricopeptide (TPR) repeat protein